jgi:kynurenine formamidase
MKLVDLTLEITSDMITFPGYPNPTFIKWSNFDTQGYVSETMFLSTHTGTHMDAPFHFDANGPTIDQVEIERYVCNNALLLKIQKDSNQMISSDDIRHSSKYEIKEKDTAIDCPSIDKGTDSGLIVHKTLLSNQILIIENLCNLYRFNNQRFTLLVTPLKLAGASGSPIRAIGIEE